MQTTCKEQWNETSGKLESPRGKSSNFPVLEELEKIKTNERELEQDEHGRKHYFIYLMTTYHVLCQALQT